jgi:hypothetical protein
LEIPTSIREHINIDVVIKLPATIAGNNTIVIIKDELTKHVPWFATMEAELTAEQFARLFIDNYLRSHGIPTSIVLDHDE